MSTAWHGPVDIDHMFERPSFSLVAFPAKKKETAFYMTDLAIPGLASDMHPP